MPDLQYYWALFIGYLLWLAPQKIIKSCLWLSKSIENCGSSIMGCYWNPAKPDFKDIKYQ